jgi:hypothetical protein
MASVLTFEQFVGGADQLVMKQDFPSSQTSLTYNFNQDITGWTVSGDYQVIVVDRITFDRYTGQPNFTTSTVIGSFPKVEITGATAPAITNASTGLVRYTIPSGMYTGALVPDARQNVAIAVVGFTWTTADTPTQSSTHRWAVIQSWEPDVAIGDPTSEGDYTALTLS